ncbi:hypothetical protein TTHERM_000502529 (macronuclear) [Tetrahymena thermophila SB210]|uniref:Uncharacterized protein n=1 Tax=Tetrahymena thermophila (strain SB210) TaxID=312017 RepID=W7XFH6_TETTS|nr:hypothetical protein TTHERM_000502529 [Tetrahymena thermophila SB210]EWS72771.1 hypothetical protein TTHERM_000502529 [Tetrahymena thermophila SB210]|eukprot:XP_012654708.1 hypothetical protein TTHERM_000502529 [Tetrahymena thermophila SB210]
MFKLKPIIKPVYLNNVKFTRAPKTYPTENKTLDNINKTAHDKTKSLSDGQDEKITKQARLAIKITNYSREFVKILQQATITGGSLQFTGSGFINVTLKNIVEAITHRQKAAKQNRTQTRNEIFPSNVSILVECLIKGSTTGKIYLADLTTVKPMNRLTGNNMKLIIFTKEQFKWQQILKQKVEIGGVSDTFYSQNCKIKSFWQNPWSRIIKVNFFRFLIKKKS